MKNSISRISRICNMHNKPDFLCFGSLLHVKTKESIFSHLGTNAKPKETRVFGPEGL